jgi:nucleoside-diphosphate-sugar epimerase
MRSWVIPAFLSSVLERKPIIVHGSGRQTRDFTYIDDAVRGTIFSRQKRMRRGRFSILGQDLRSDEVMQTFVSKVVEDFRSGNSAEIFYPLMADQSRRRALSREWH